MFSTTYNKPSGIRINGRGGGLVRKVDMSIVGGPFPSREMWIWETNSRTSAMFKHITHTHTYIHIVSFIRRKWTLKHWQAPTYVVGSFCHLTKRYVCHLSLVHVSSLFLLLLFISNQIEGIQSIYNLICCLVIVSWKGDHPAMSPQSCRSEVQRLFSLRLLIGCVSVSTMHFSRLYDWLPQKSGVVQEYIDLRLQVVLASKFCTVAPNICGTSVWNLLHVTFLAPRILRWLPDLWKVCAFLV